MRYTTSFATVVAAACLALVTPTGGAVAGSASPSAAPDHTADNGTTEIRRGDIGAHDARTPLTGWQPAADLNHARSRTGLAYHQGTGRFYAMGGEGLGSTWNLPIEAYDPVVNTWTNRANLLVGVSNTGVASVGGFLYVPGGWDGGTAHVHMQRYNPATNVVQTVAPMPVANAAHAVAAHKGLIHVLGGSATALEGDTHYVYNPITNTWTTRAPLPVAVNYPTAVSDGTFIYVIGGNPTNANFVQRYNPSTNTWSMRAPLLAGRGGPGSFFAGGKVWVVGGGWSSYLTSTEAYTSATNSWSSGLPLATGARTLGAAFGNNLALKAGGYNAGYLAIAERQTFLHRRPDAHIKSKGAYRGDDIYNTTGKGQKRKAKVRAGKMFTFSIRMQNDGNYIDRYRIKSPKGTRVLQAKYFKGTKNITRKVVRGTYRTTTLQPGASEVIRLQVKVAASAGPRAKQTWRAVVRSVGDRTVVDVVKATVTRR